MRPVINYYSFCLSETEPPAICCRHWRLYKTRKLACWVDTPEEAPTHRENVPLHLPHCLFTVCMIVFSVPAAHSWLNFRLMYTYSEQADPPRRYGSPQAIRIPEPVLNIHSPNHKYRLRRRGGSRWREVYHLVKTKGQKDTSAKVKLREKAGLTHVNTPLPERWC